MDFGSVCLYGSICTLASSIVRATANRVNDHRDKNNKKTSPGLSYLTKTFVLVCEPFLDIWVGTL
jgi:hypothetical protein